jgi:superfamily II DNA or RNA helicase
MEVVDDRTKGSRERYFRCTSELCEGFNRLRGRFDQATLQESRSWEAIDAPRVLSDEHSITWQVSCGGTGAQVYVPEVSAFAVPNRVRGTWSYRAEMACQCEQFTKHKTCPHVYVILRNVLTALRESNYVELGAHLWRIHHRCVEMTGRQMIERLAGLVNLQNRKEEQGKSKLQWRFGWNGPYSTFEAYAYQQSLNERTGKWSSGRRLNPSHYRDTQLFCRQIDIELAEACGVYEGSWSYSIDSSNPEILPLLQRHPNVVWAEDQQRRVHFREGELGLDFDKADGDDFALRVRVGECQFRHGDLEMKAAVMGARRMRRRFVIYDPQADAVWYSERLRDEVCTWLSEYLAVRDRELKINVQDAGDLVSAIAASGTVIRMSVPESIAGPVEALDALVHLVMRPCNDTLEISLQIHDERLSEPLVPGEGATEIAVVTTLGPRRLQRNLELERASAVLWCEKLGLTNCEAQDYEVHGELRWLCRSLEAAVTFLERLRDLGDDAPPVLWPEGEKMEVIGSITPGSLRVRLEDKRDWFGISGSVEFEGGEISLGELLEAVRRGEGFVRLKGGAFARISSAFRKRLVELGDAVHLERGGLRVAQVMAPTVQEIIGDDCQLEVAQRWSEMIQRIEAAKKLKPKLPKGFNAELRHYQREGFDWMSRLSAWGAGGVLADDMGLGKTVQTLGVLLQRSKDGPALVVAPTSVAENWMREAQRFAPNLCPVLYRDHDRDMVVEQAGPFDVVVTSYALLQRDIKRFSQRSWHTLILDEAQFIKNSATKTARAAREIQADWRLALSGTPLENHLGELWSLMRTVVPGLFGSWESFRTRFAEPIEKHQDAEKRKGLARLIQPFVLRRTKDNVLKELPARTELNLFAEMSGLERKRYDAARLQALQELEGVELVEEAGKGSPRAKGKEKAGQERLRVLAWLTRLRQLSCHPRLVDAQWRGNSAKLNLFLETIKELREGGHRALVFSQFVQHLQLVREALDERKIKYQYLDGSTPAKERQVRVDAFQAGEGELFLISLKAGGTGLNLTAANYVIHLDPWWNPAVEDQATDRAHRIGQEKPVTVLRLIARDTIEEQILELHADKRELVANVLEGTDRAGRMSTSELVSLIRN